MDTRVGFIGIIVEDREASAKEVNLLISQFADSIIARTGVPYKEKDVSVITLVVDMDSDMIGELTGKLGACRGVTVKSGLSKK